MGSTWGPGVLVTQWNVHGTGIHLMINIEGMRKYEAYVTLEFSNKYPNKLRVTSLEEYIIILQMIIIY